VDEHEALIDARKFGRYLRKVREERRLSLEAVEEMSVGFPERLTKSHLSRIENGQAVPTFPRMFTLSQIYGVPVTSLAERFEIELWKTMKAPDVTGLCLDDLRREAHALKLAGKYVEMLALASAALEGPPPAEGAIRVFSMLCRIDALVHLERYETAKSECEQLLGAAELTEEDRVKALVSLAICCYRLQRYEVARIALDEADRRIVAHPQAKLAGDVQQLRGSVFRALGQTDAAVRCYERATQIYGSVPAPFEACQARINLGFVLLERGDLREAAECLEQSLAVADASAYDRLKALALSHLGLIALRRGDDREAEARFLRSNLIARAREYVSVVFRNCYHLWSLASKNGDTTSVKANERTLRTYLGRVDAHLDEARAYREHVARGADE
jgi:tetratricopeptide (TPR) repeat protein